MLFIIVMPKFVMIISGFLVLSCLLPGMISMDREPAAAMPTMKKDPDALLKALRGGDWVYLRALAEEQYTEMGLPILSPAITSMNTI